MSGMDLRDNRGGGTPMDVSGTPNPKQISEKLKFLKARNGIPDRSRQFHEEENISNFLLNNNTE